MTAGRRSAGQGGAAWHVGLLRAVNVGGRNRLPMADLKRIVAEAGGAEARTYLQSGNVIFRAPKSAAAGIGREVARRIEQQFGFTSPVIVRSGEQLAAVVAQNPFLEAEADGKSLHVVFLAKRPGKAQAGALDPDRSPGDLFELRGSDLYLHLPKGVARTKLTTPYLEKALGCPCTGRNWRTVTALVEMCD